MISTGVEKLCSAEDSTRTERKVVSTLTDDLSPEVKTKDIRRFVHYYFASEKHGKAATLSCSELKTVYEKCQKAVGQHPLLVEPKVGKLHAADDLKSMTVISGGKNVTKSKYEGTRGWVGGWLTTKAKDAEIDLELDEPRFVTRMMLYTFNTRARPRNLELLAREEGSEEWQLVRSFLARNSSGHLSNGDYGKREMFYVLGKTSNWTDSDHYTWPIHPLAGPGWVTGGDPDFYISSKYWKLRIVDSYGDYNGINDLILYGRPPGLPAPVNLAATPSKDGVLLTWEIEEFVEVDHYEIVVYAGGFGHYSFGTLRKCSGDLSHYHLLDLIPGIEYQFQVIAVDSQGLESIPSKASEKILVREGMSLNTRRAENPVSVELLGEGNCSEGGHSPTKDEHMTPERREEIVDGRFHGRIPGQVGATDRGVDSNTITLFISGSLEDTIVERTYISQFVVPNLELWCNTNGYDLHAVDLRWGLSIEGADGRDAFAVHMQELERAYRQSAMTIFYFISGDRCGSLLLPAVISQADRDAVRSELDKNMQLIMDSAYVLDENKDPPIYRLQEATRLKKHRTGENDKTVHSLVKGFLDSMRKNTLATTGLRSWQPSLTLAECNCALSATKTGNHNKFLYAKRTLNNLYQALELEQDLPSEKQKARIMGCTDIVERKLVDSLRSRLDNSSRKHVCKKEYSFDWNESGIDLGREDKAMKDLCLDALENIKAAITEELGERRDPEDTEKEILHHLNLAKSTFGAFVGREDLMGKTMNSIAESTGRITVIHGVSGTGKTSLMCAAACRVKEFLPKETLSIVRICGTSSQSRSAQSLVRSICAEISVNLNEKESIPHELEELVHYFHELLEKVSTVLPVALFIDGLDQLEDEVPDGSKSLMWIPKFLSGNVYLVVSTDADAKSAIMPSLMQNNPVLVDVPLLEKAESLEMLNYWLQTANRKITATQRGTVVNCLNEAEGRISILHLRFIYDRASQWSSSYVPSPLPINAQKMIAGIFEKLENDHGRHLVASYLSLLASSRDGLSLNNVIDIVSTDEHVLGGRGQPGTILDKHDPPIRRVPPYPLIKLNHDLGDYVVHRVANGVRVYQLCHQQFVKAVKRRYLSDEKTTEKVHQQLIEYFSGETGEKYRERKVSRQPLWFTLDGKNRATNRQKLAELSHALIKKGDIDAHADLITNFDYIEATFEAGDNYAASLIQDYSLSMRQLAGTEKGREVESFFRFVSRQFHDLSIDPRCITSLAANSSRGSVVAKKLFERHNATSPFHRGILRWINCPTVADPCVTTIAVAEADCITSARASLDTHSTVVTGNGFSGIYDLRTRQLIRSFDGHVGWVRTVSLSPDSRYALTVANDHTGKVWNLSSADLCCTLSGHLSWVTDCDWVFDDSMVMTVSEDGSARLWNPYFGYLIAINEHHLAGVNCCKFSPSGNEAVTGDSAGNLFKWKTDTLAVISRREVGSSITCVQWSKASGIIAATTYDGFLLVMGFDLTEIQNIQVSSFPIHDCVFSPDGNELLLACADRLGRLFRVEDGSLIGELHGSMNQVTSTDWISTRYGDFLLTGSEDPAMKKWEREDVPVRDIYYCFAEGSFIPTGAFAADYSIDDDLYGIDALARLWKSIKPLSTNADPSLDQYASTVYFPDGRASDLSADGTQWIIAGYSKISRLVSASGGETIRKFNLDRDYAHTVLKWKPGGNQKFLAGAHGGIAVLWNAQSGNKDCDFGIKTWVFGGSWSPDGTRVAICGWDLTRIYDMTQEYSEGDVLDAAATVVSGLNCAFNSDGSRLAISGSPLIQGEEHETSGYIFDTSSLGKVKELVKLDGPSRGAHEIIFSRDDRYIIADFEGSAGRPPEIYVYASNSGDVIATFSSPANRNFKRLAVPYKKFSRFSAVDIDGHLFNFEIVDFPLATLT